MKHFFFSFSITFVALLFLLFAVPVYADDGVWGDCLVQVGDAEVVTISCIPHLVFNIVTFAVSSAGVVALAMIIFAAYKMIFSGGDPKQLESARKTATYAILGLILVFFSYFIINFIAQITGVDCISLFGLNQCL